LKINLSILANAQINPVKWGKVKRASSTKEKRNYTSTIFDFELCSIEFFIKTAALIETKHLDRFRGF
jgi:hypothetical protein